MDEFIFDADEDVLAALFSLPVAWLLWSVICFAIGVLGHAWLRIPTGNLRFDAIDATGVTLSFLFVSGISLSTWIVHRWASVRKEPQAWYGEWIKPPKNGA